MFQKHPHSLNYITATETKGGELTMDHYLFTMSLLLCRFDSERLGHSSSIAFISRILYLFFDNIFTSHGNHFT